jgi:DcuC family C4-dicarboxylate transporter
VALFALHATNVPPGQRLGAFTQVFVEFAKGLTNPQSVVPICSAMGFAYVCKLTGCDAHLVHLLTRPLRHVRWLMIPGGVAVAFLVNSAIVSQTSTVSVVGPVLIPLVLAAGFSRVTAGALLLLGGSMGGELLNPAAVEVNAVKAFTDSTATDVISHLLPYNLLASGTALVVFWGMSLWYERKRTANGAGQEVFGVGGEESLDVAAPEPGSIAATMSKSYAEQLDRINVFKALVPLVPIVLLMSISVAKGRGWITMPAPLVPSETNKIAEQATIAAAMIIGVVCAGFVSPRQSGKLVAAFFEGAGFVYAHVISIIAAAAMFAEGVKLNGLIEMTTNHLRHAPAAVTVASVVIPWIMACVTGTAVGTAPLVINIIVPIAAGIGGPARSAAAIATAFRIGSVNAIASQFGRTSSPVAPVTIMCATLARTRPIDLVKRVTPPLIAGGVVLLIAALMGR